MEEIATRLNMSKSSVFRIVHASRNDKQKRRTSKVYRKAGGPEKLNARQIRNLQRAITRIRKNNPNFTVMDVVKESGIDLNVSHYRTFLRAIRRLSFPCRASRKKGILLENDL